MKLSYAVTVCDEFIEIQRLLTQLIAQKHPQDEIVVLLDKPKASKQLELLLEGYAHSKKIVLAIDYFEGHFANWKNNLTSHCTGDYIFQIDADEYFPDDFINTLHEFIEANPEIDMYYVPRINTVEGITEEHIKRWGWRYENNRVNWPDYQTRIYKNIPDIKWRNAVHEVLEGYKKFGILPAEDIVALIHPKTIERQEKQNNFYQTL